jgi:hypothetical protein
MQFDNFEIRLINSGRKIAPFTTTLIFQGSLI